MSSYNVTFDDSSPMISYQGSGWSSAKAEDPNIGYHFRQSRRQTSTNQDSASFTFKGSDVWLYGAKTPNTSDYVVEIDGQSQQYSGVPSTPGSNEYQSVLGSAHGLDPSRDHTIIVKNDNVNNPSRKNLSIDFITVTIPIPDSSSIVTSTFDNPDPSFTYSSAWSGNFAPPSGYYNNTVWYTITNGRYVTFTFEGDSVAVYGAVNKDHGDYTVALDGGSTTRYNGTYAYSQTQTVLYHASGLSTGTHKVVLTNLGQGTTNTLDIDFAVVNRTMSGATTSSPGNIAVATTAVGIVQTSSVSTPLSMVTDSSTPSSPSAEPSGNAAGKISSNNAGDDSGKTSTASDPISRPSVIPEGFETNTVDIFKIPKATDGVFAVNIGSSEGETSYKTPMIGAIVGSVFAALLCLGSIFAIFWIIRKRRKQGGHRRIEEADNASGVSSSPGAAVDLKQFYDGETREYEQQYQFQFPTQPNRPPGEAGVQLAGLRPAPEVSIYRESQLNDYEDYLYSVGSSNGGRNGAATHSQVNSVNPTRGDLASYYFQQNHQQPQIPGGFLGVIRPPGTAVASSQANTSPGSANGEQEQYRGTTDEAARTPISVAQSNAKSYGVSLPSTAYPNELPGSLYPSTLLDRDVSTTPGTMSQTGYYFPGKSTIASLSSSRMRVDGRPQDFGPLPSGVFPFGSIFGIESQHTKSSTGDDFKGDGGESRTEIVTNPEARVSTWSDSPPEYH